MECKYCGNQFDRSKFHPGQRYCSAFCCQKDWRKRNPDRMKFHRHKYNMKKPLLCKGCGQEITISLRKNGVVYCSDECRKEAEAEGRRGRYRKIHDAFRHYKIQLGCQKCGYDKCAACLDFHHLRDKRFRIGAKRWYYQTEEVRKEMKNCILLCKNCHYEVHNGFDVDGDLK